MIQGSMSMGQAGIVSLASMLVVFSVLLLLYVILVVFGKVATRNVGTVAPAVSAGAAGAPAAAPRQDDAELIAVLSAAIAEYERTKCNPFIRNRQDLD
ncbi:Na(+)-transporting decarboxylase [Oscillibacter valericigenes Sjm18-20]|nr:Na(+)-transporting decarboxylase [Oscillibacter valericigenes Sjm18-20]